MTTRVTITGTGTPVYAPGRAGPGVLVRHGDVALQFDAGQATRLRMSETDFQIADLTAVFITHHHSDHMVGLTDVLITRWLEVFRRETSPLPVFAPDGMAAQIAEDLIDAWEDEVAMRVAHAGYPNASPRPDVRRFVAADTLDTVASFGDVDVAALLVEHHPVVPAVGYRITTPDGAVAISGDTRVCPALEELCRDVDVAVCEVIRPQALAGLLSNPEAIARYHADVTELGEMATRADVGHLVLTHLIPPPKDDADKQAFVDDIREAGFHGSLTVADDLDNVDLDTVDLDTVHLTGR